VISSDRLDCHVRWNGDPDLGRLAGKPLQLRFVFNDADIYALRFTGK